MDKTTEKSARFPTDDEFIEQFKNKNMYKGRKQIIHRLTREQQNSNGVQPNWEHEPIHVDHINPQKPKNGNKVIKDENLHKAGNLTCLLGKINSKVKNGTFKEKKSYYKESNITVNEKIADREMADDNEIEKRTEELARFSVEVIWKSLDAYEKELKEIQKKLGRV